VAEVQYIVGLPDKKKARAKEVRQLAHARRNQERGIPVNSKANIVKATTNPKQEVD
jgi:hypothetical protein